MRCACRFSAVRVGRRSCRHAASSRAKRRADRAVAQRRPERCSAWPVNPMVRQSVFCASIVRKGRLLDRIVPGRRVCITPMSAVCCTWTSNHRTCCWRTTVSRCCSISILRTRLARVVADNWIASGGTPGYMSPEQQRSIQALRTGRPVPIALNTPLPETEVTNNEKLAATLSIYLPTAAGVGSFYLDPRSDIYSLGVLLYESLAGPDSAGRRERIATLCCTRPTRWWAAPGGSAAQMPREDRQARYADAGELAEDCGGTWPTCRCVGSATTVSRSVGKSGAGENRIR